MGRLDNLQTPFTNILSCGSRTGVPENAAEKEGPGITGTLLLICSKPRSHSCKFHILYFYIAFSNGLGRAKASFGKAKVER